MKNIKEETKDYKCEFADSCKLHQRDMKLSNGKKTDLEKKYCLSENHTECARHQSSHILGHCNVPMFILPDTQSYVDTLKSGEKHSKGWMKDMKATCSGNKKKASPNSR